MYAEHFRLRFINAKDSKVKGWTEKDKTGTAAQLICRYCGDDAYNTKGWPAQKDALNAIVQDDKTWIGLELHLMQCTEYDKFVEQRK